MIDSHPEVEIEKKIEDLPDIPLEIIATHLTSAELAACCAVNHSWRDLFNRDELWRHRCDQELAEYLQDTPCVVEPGFVNPEVEGSGLSSVCQFRMQYMRQNHLQNNWRRGICKYERVSIEDGSAQISKSLMFCGNSTLLRASKEELEILDLTSNCIPISPQPFSVAPMKKIFFCDISGDKLVVVQPGIIQVFQISKINQDWSMIQSFSFDKETHFTSFNLPLQYLFLGKYFVSVKKDALLIWNIESNDVRKEEYNIKFYFPDDCKKFPKSTPHVVLVNKHLGLDQQSLLLYSLEELSFKPFVPSNTYNTIDGCVLQDQYIAIYGFRAKMHCHVLEIYNYETNFKINFITFSSGLNFRLCNKHVFALFDNMYISRAVMKLTLATGSVDRFIEIGGIVQSQNVFFCHKLITQLRSLKSVLEIDCSANSRIATRSILFPFESFSCVSKNELFTVFIIKENVNCSDADFGSSPYFIVYFW